MLEMPTAQRITFVGNCQTRALFQLYQSFVGRLRGDAVTFIELYQDIRESGQEALSNADVIVEQLLDIAPRTMVGGAKPGARRRLVPLASCAFLWPFAGEPRPGNEPTWYNAGGPFPAELSDSFLNRLIRKGVPAEEAAERYLNLDINSARNLDRLYELFMDRQRRRDEISGFQIAPLIAEHFRAEPIFFTPHHPNVRIIKALAEQLFRLLNVDEDTIERMKLQLQRSPFPWQRLPIHPQVARHFGLVYADERTRYRYGHEGYQTFQDWALNYSRGECNEVLREGIALASSDPVAALKRLDPGLERSPDSPDGHFAKGEALRHLNRLDEAEVHLRDAVELAPDEPHFRHALAVILQRLGRWHDSVEEARSAIRLDPNNHHTHAVLAHSAWRAGDIKQADQAAREAVALEPANAHLHNLLAHVLVQAGELSEAEECLRRAVALAPEHAGFYEHLSRIVSRQGRTEEAVAFSRQGIAVDAGNFQLYLNLFRDLKELNRLNEAEAALREGAAAVPTSAEIPDQLGHFLAAAGRIEEAIVAFKEAVRLNPNIPARLAALSRTLARAQHWNAALDAARVALAIDPNDAGWQANLGSLLRQTGRMAEAEAAYTQAISIAPDYQQARRELEELRKENVGPPDAGNDRTAIGKDGWLFHRIDAVFEQVCEGRGFSDRNLSRMLSLWEARQSWCAARNIEYRIFIVPERHVLYADKLPNGFAPHLDRPALRLIRSADKHLRQAIIYPAERIRRGRAVREVCYRSDVHWSRWGAYLGYCELMELLPDRLGVVVPQSALAERQIQVLGDMMMWLDRRDREFAMFLEPPEVPVKELYTNRTFKPGQVDVFETDRRGLSSLVLFRTSNSTHLLPFLYHHFSRIVAVASTAVHFDLLRSERPDFVISELSERYLAAPHEPPTEDWIRFPIDFDIEFLRGFYGGEPALAARSGLGRFRSLARFGHQPGRIGAAHPRDVVLVFQQCSEGLVHDLRLQLGLVEVPEGCRPVDRLRHARQLEQVLRAQLLDERNHLGGQVLRNVRRFHAKNGALPRSIGIIDPMIQAAAPDRVMHFPRTVRRHYHHRRDLRPDRAKFRNADLKVGQNLQQEGFERLIGAVEFVDQQHGGRQIGVDRGEKGAGQKVFAGVYVA